MSDICTKVGVAGAMIGGGAAVVSGVGIPLTGAAAVAGAAIGMKGCEKVAELLHSDPTVTASLSKMKTDGAHLPAGQDQAAGQVKAGGQDVVVASR